MSVTKEKIFLCSICNINSGTCLEDCKFCSQSVRYKADIERYKQKDMDIILEEAKVATTPGIDFGDFNNYIRIAYTKNINELEIAAKRIKNFIKNIK